VIKLKKELSKIGILSVFKIYLLLGLVFGLIFGGVYGLMFAIFGASMMGFIGGDQAAMSGLMMIIAGLVIVVVATLLYGLILGISGAITAAIYNIAAKIVGGVELELEDKT